MRTGNLDEVERDDLLLEPTVPDALDVRDVVKSSAPILAYLQFLAIGPLAIGTLAIVTSASEPWERFHVMTGTISSYSEGVAVPQSLLVGTLTTKERPAIQTRGAVSPVSANLPLINVRIYKPEIAEIQFDITMPETTLAIAGEESALPATPNPPTLVTAE